MQTRRTSALGQKGAKKFIGHNGEQMVCLRYRYNERRRKRFTTVEIIVEQSGWSPPEKPAILEIANGRPSPLDAYPIMLLPQSAAGVPKGCRAGGPRSWLALISITLGSQTENNAL
jgi:hypothetical protein